MPLTAGSRLGPYEVLAAIGAGGMGEVYRARDGTLHRDVALKILPEPFALDADRLARFRREAQVLAALNHPNIAAIYGFEESTSVHALVLELVEGPTLADRLAQGAMPLDEALPIARQIAEALEAAHEQGIIHRDLKPANIKLRPDGTVKVLDFGLAKALGPDSGQQAAGGRRAGTGGALSQSPTMTSPAMMTGIGVLLGTAAYMSPEQAKGRPADKRSDVWAFGAVFFEMVTGERAFPGDDVADTIAAVVRAEPDWARLPLTLPPALVTCVKRCLHKEPRQRIPDIGMMRLALDGAFETTPPIVSTSPSSSSRSRAAMWVAGFGVVAATLALMVAPILNDLREEPATETRVDIVTPPTDDLSSFALSPDGRQLAFVASDGGVSSIWLRPLGSTAATPLSGTEGATYPFWSPDSRSLGFFANAKLKRLDLGSSVPQTLANASARGGTWNTDGIIVFQQRNDGPLMRIASSGGEAVAVTTVARQSSHRFPFFLPDGRQFLFVAQGVPDARGIYLGSLDSSDTYLLTPDPNAGVFVPPGWLLWPRDGILVAQAVDLDKHALVGEPVTVADSVISENDFTSSAISASASGLVAYRSGNASQRQLVWFDRSGKQLGTMGLPDATLNRPSVSPDGLTVAVDRLIQGNTDVWLMSAVRTTRFTLDPALERFPVWSPDGSHIAFDSNRRGFRDLYEKATSGAGTEDLLVESPQTKIPNDWSRDGRFLLYVRVEPRTGRDLWIRPMAGSQTPFAFLSTPAEERFGQFSSDGRWVAYMSNESGRDEVYIRPFALPSDDATGGQARGQWQVSTSGGIHPRWRSDGRELYYLAPSGEMMAAPTPIAAGTLIPGTPMALFQTRVHGGGLDKQQGRQFDVARDGRFIINTLVGDSVSPITLLQNWNPTAVRPTN